MTVSIKEKAKEIKGGNGFEEGASAETFFLLEAPKKPQLNPLISGLFAAVLVTTSVGSYALGHYAGKNGAAKAPMTPKKSEVQISRIVQDIPGNETNAASSTRVEGAGQSQTAAAAMATQGAYVGSKKGSKYHLPWCPGAKAISDVNKVWFESKEEAEAKGYSKAANCKGL